MRHIRQWIISIVLAVIILGLWTPKEAYGEDRSYGFFAFFSEKGYNIYYDVITLSPKNNLMINTMSFYECMNVELSYNEKANTLTIENLNNEKKLVFTVGSKNYKYYDEKNPKGVKQTAEYACYYDNNAKQYMVSASTFKYIMSISIKENCYFDGSFYKAVILCSDYLPVKQMEKAVSTKLEIYNDDSDTITLKNSLIEDAVREELDKPKGSLTEWEVSKIKKLDLSEMDLTDISDLKHFTGLEVLNLENNDLQYIGSLRYLKNLKELNLNSNSISNLEPLSELTKLKKLKLGSNTFSDISPLTYLTGLEELELSYLYDNIKDFSPISFMSKLKKLQIRFTYVPDINFLKKCSQLTELTLFNAGISNLAPLKELTNLVKLDIGQNKIKSLDEIKKLTKLTYLNASVNNIIKIDGLKGLNKLTYLNLNYNDIKELGPVGKLTKLETLYVKGNELTDIKAVKSLKKLKVLDVANNRITDVGAISHLSNLTGLYMENNFFTDYSSVFKLKKLEDLGLCNSMILDYRPLKSLQSQLDYQDFDIDRDTAVAEKATQIISKVIKKGMTDLEKETAIHDYLVLNCEYDYINYLNGTIPDASYTVYGTLINGKAVCEGYAAAFEYLMERIGIRCGTVIGRAYGVNGWDGHSWNIVMLDGEYYHVDVTFDDPVNAKPGSISREYFNMTDHQLWEDHRWNADAYFCTSLKYNRYFLNDTLYNPLKDGATYELSGKITLASGIKVPSDGLTVELYCEKDGWSGNYGTLVKIPYGENSASYRFNVPKALQNFTLSVHVTDSNDIAHGYYSAQGNNLEYKNMTPVNSSRHTNLNITMFKAPGNPSFIHLPITVALPKGEAAPKGGISLKVRLGDVNARDGEVYIPEDENSVTIDWDTGLYEATTAYLGYEIEPFAEGYRTIGYYYRDKMTTDSLQASRITVKEGNSYRIELIKGLDSYKISGRISLPEGQVAPAGGLTLIVYAEATDNRSDRPWAQIPIVKKELNIAKGTSSIDYQLEVKEDGSQYRVYYKLKEKSDKYINQAYYAGAGMALSYMDALPIEDSNSTGIDMNIIGTYIIKGKVSLPAGEVAPRGGFEVAINVNTDNPYTVPEDTYSTSAFVTIPEGERAVEYQVQVIPSKWKYHVYYWLSTDPTNEKFNKYYYSGKMSNKGNLLIEVNSDFYDANIEIVRN